MKVGDLVRVSQSGAIGIIVDITQKKVWRIHDHGDTVVPWNKVEPEPHANVFYSQTGGVGCIPIAELEVIG